MFEVMPEDKTTQIDLARWEKFLSDNTLHGRGFAHYYSLHRGDILELGIADQLLLTKRLLIDLHFLGIARISAVEVGELVVRIRHVATPGFPGGFTPYLTLARQRGAELEPLVEERIVAQPERYLSLEAKIDSAETRELVEGLARAVHAILASER
jgi:hypothetical protein